VKLQEAVPAASRRRTRYADPTGQYLATLATPWRRAGAAAVDWALCYALFIFASIPLGMIQNIGRISWEEGDFGGHPGHVVFLVAQALTLLPIVGYWALLLPTSQTLGMRATGLRSVELKTGLGISRLRAALRGAVATLFALATYAVFLDSTKFDKGEEHLSARTEQMLDASYVLFTIACVSAAVMLFSPSRRSLFDRLFGSVTLDELEAVTPQRRGPWGPLDAFDTSR
jgi:RDD family